MASSASALQGEERLLTPGEVAALFRVDPKTVTRWAKAGKLTSIRTMGGHRRYRESEVMSFLMDSEEGRPVAEGDGGQPGGSSPGAAAH